MLFFRLFLSLIESKLIKGLFIWRVEDPSTRKILEGFLYLFHYANYSCFCPRR